MRFPFLETGCGTPLFVCICIFLFVRGPVLSASESGGVFLFTGLLIVAVWFVCWGAIFLLLATVLFSPESISVFFGFLLVPTESESAGWWADG